MQSLVPVWQCFRQGRFGEVHAQIAGLAESSEVYQAAQVLGIRCLIEQGLIGQALSRAQVLLAQPFVRHYHVQLYFYHAFLQSLQDNTEAHLRELQGWIENQQQAVPPNERLLAALLADFQQRAEWVFVALGQRSKAQWRRIAEGTFGVAAHYREAGAVEEAWATLLRGAGACQKAPFADFTLVKAWLSQVIEEATQREQPLFVGEALLMRGEAGFHQSWVKDLAAPTNEEICHDFEQSIHWLQRGQHCFAEAKVLHRFGECMLKSGAPEGVDLLRQAHEGLANVQAYPQRQSLWRSLHTWHLRRGEPQPAREALEASQHLTATINWGIGAHVDRLGKVDETFREGKTAVALDTLTPLMIDKPATLVSVSALSLSSTILGQTGRASEALPGLGEAIRQLSPEGDTPLLTQTWMIRSFAYKNGAAECIDCLSQAIAICEQLGDGQQQGYLLTLRANQKLQALRLQRPGERIQLTNDILADFEQARTLLLRYRNLEAMEMLGTLCQQWGIAYFVAREYGACGRWLVEAEAVHRQLGLKPGLAFTLSYQGLVLMEIGRTAGPATYDQAISRFRQAGQLFEEAGLGAMMWRMRYYEGLAQYEAGQRENAGAGQRTERWEQAGQLLRQASEQIDRLRGFSGGGASQQGQHAGAAFMVDKQTVYTTGLQLAYLAGQPDTMLYWLEQMKGRAMLDALGELQLPDSTLLEHPLVLRERELWEQKAQAPEVAQALTIQQQIDDLLDQLLQDPRTQSYANARKKQPIAWPWIRDWLRTEEQNGQGRHLLLVSYYCTAGLTLVIGMRADWEKPRWERLAVDYKIMSVTIRDYFRQPGGLRMALEDWGEGEWQRLQPLVYPVSLWSRPGDVIGLVPYGILHDTPLHTLKVQDQYLIERNPVFYLPALSLLPGLSLVARPPLHVTNRVSVLGDSRGDLPHARTEAGFVSGLFGATAQVGADVTRQTVLQALAGADLMHFAGHGELSAQSGLESGLLLAGGDTLRAKDLFGHQARTKLVVLSGCETGLSQHQEGDELFGFVRMLILSGVPSLLVSQWRVNDAATRALLEHLYLHLLRAPDAGIAVALQQAMLAVAKERPHWKSFYYWGGFVAIGHWK